MRINRNLLAALMFSSMVALAGCNTIEGVGEDIDSAGDSIEDTAEDCSDNVEGNC